MRPDHLAAIAGHAIRARWRWGRLGAERLAAFHDRRMARITAFAAARSPFYREHWRGHDPAEWRTLPEVDKALMMEHFSRFNTAGVEREQALELAMRAERERDFAPTLGGLTVGLSSGTSGHRGLFLVSPAEQRAWAGTILARTVHGWRRRPLRVAFFLRANSNLYEQVGGRLVRFRYFDLLEPLERAIAGLNAFQPDILAGPPSLLELLGRELGGALHIRPERLISVAEVLEPQDARRLHGRFDAPVHQIYQCTEGLIAASCRLGALHIQEDVVALQGEPLAADPARCTPIVTDLWRTTQPIVRYRLNDVLTLARQPCRCGSAFRVIESIEGRGDDLFEFAGAGGALRPIFPDLIRRIVLLASPDVADYQAIQDRPGQIEFRLELRAGADWDAAAQATRASLATTLAGYGCRAGEVAVVRGLLPPPPGAKRRRVWRRAAG